MAKRKGLDDYFSVPDRKKVAQSKLDALQQTAEEQRKAYQRDGRLGRATGNEMTKAKPKYQAATPPKPPRKGGDNIDKAYTKSSNPAKNRPFPGTIKQYGDALERAYNAGRAEGARMAGAKTASVPGKVIRPMYKYKISPVTGRPIPQTGSGVGRGGARAEFRAGGGGGEGGIMKRKIR